MLDRLPDRLFPERLAKKSAVLKGCCPLDSSVRLAEIAHSLPADVELELRFSQHATGCALIEGVLRTELELLCQRCLQSFNWPLNAEIKLTVQNSGDIEDKPSPPGFEPLIVDDDAGIETLRLLEDEIIVRLPAVPAHSKPELCDQNMVKRSKEFDEHYSKDLKKQTGDNPFAVLKKLT